jgi:hypothetical protein
VLRKFRCATKAGIFVLIRSPMITFLHEGVIPIHP